MCDNNITLQRIRKLIDDSKKSREEIAKSKELNCDTSTITKHYNGDRSISSEYIVKYAKYFNVSADYLLGLSNAETSDKDIQFICDYTGLNEKSVKLLDFYKNEFVQLINDEHIEKIKQRMTIGFNFLDFFIKQFDIFTFPLEFIEREQIIKDYKKDKNGLNQNINHLKNIARTFERNLSINTFVVTEKYKKIYEEFCETNIKVGVDNGNNTEEK